MSNYSRDYTEGTKAGIVALGNAIIESIEGEILSNYPTQIGHVLEEFRDMVLTPDEADRFRQIPLAPTDDLARLQAENARLRAALAWYADDANYLVEKVVYDKHGLPWYAYVAEGDVQERARKALEGGE